jgi:hypothetical protein
VYLQVKGDWFNLLGPFGKITYGANGFHLLHHTGARIDLGGIGGLPAPLDELGTYATISAAILKLQGTAIVLGPDTGVAEPAAKAIALQTVLVAIGAALTATASALSALGNASAGAAIAAAVAAIGVGATAVPAQSTSVT